MIISNYSVIFEKEKKAISWAFQPEKNGKRALGTGQSWKRWKQMRPASFSSCPRHLAYTCSSINPMYPSAAFTCHVVPLFSSHVTHFGRHFFLQLSLTIATILLIPKLASLVLHFSRMNKQIETIYSISKM